MPRYYVWSELPPTLNFYINLKAKKNTYCVLFKADLRTLYNIINGSFLKYKFTSCAIFYIDYWRDQALRLYILTGFPWTSVKVAYNWRFCCFIIPQKRTEYNKSKSKAYRKSLNRKFQTRVRILVYRVWAGLFRLGSPSDITIIFIIIRGVCVAYVLVVTPKNIIIKTLMIDIIIVIRKWWNMFLWLWLCLWLCLCRSGNVKSSAHRRSHNDVQSFIAFCPMKFLVPVICSLWHCKMAFTSFEERSQPSYVLPIWQSYVLTILWLCLWLWLWWLCRQCNPSLNVY